MATDDTTTEEWRPVPGFDGCYLASNLGRIWSAITNRVLVGVLNTKGGYLRVKLHRGSIAKLRWMIHHVVWVTFNGPIPSGFQVNHRDGCHTNNRLDNFELSTSSDDRLHSIHVLGNHPPSGKHHWRSKKPTLDDNAVATIRKERAGGVSTKTLAKRFGVVRTTIDDIIRRRTHKGRSTTHRVRGSTEGTA